MVPQGEGPAGLDGADRTAAEAGPSPSVTDQTSIGSGRTYRSFTDEAEDAIRWHEQQEARSGPPPRDRGALATEGEFWSGQEIRSGGPVQLGALVGEYAQETEHQRAVRLALTGRACTTLRAAGITLDDVELIAEGRAPIPLVKLAGNLLVKAGWPLGDSLNAVPRLADLVNYPRSVEDKLEAAGVDPWAPAPAIPGGAP